MVWQPDESDFELGDGGSASSARRSRVVRWTAILIVASFVLAGLSSLSNSW
jgi:hypothetical protein